MDYINPAKRIKPIPGGETEDEYRRVMKKIMEGLTKDNLETILFLCKDHVPVGREITSAVQLLNYLESRDVVSRHSAVFIAECLHIIRRMDLLKIIPCIKNKKHFETEFLGLSYSQFSNYRVLTVKLQEDLSQSDFEIFKYQCSQHLNIRSIDSATNVLTLLRSLEEEDVISHDDFENLLKILECIDNVKPLKMFQRLLEGDETVAVPATKQQQHQFQNSEAIFPDRHYIPEQSSPPPAYDVTRRVEEMPYNPDPPAYQPRNNPNPSTQNQKWYTEANTDAKHHTESARTMYDISPEGGLAWDRRINSGPHTRPFEGGESTPKRLFGTTPGSENSRSQFFSLPAQHMDHHHRHYSDNNIYPSIPQGGYRVPQHHEDTFYQPHTFPHVATYPQNMGQLQYRDQPIGMHDRHPVQQQLSRDSPQQFPFQPPNMNSLISPQGHRPTHMVAIPPPDFDNKLTPLQEDFKDLSLNPEETWKNEANKNSGGAFISDGEETQANKATVSMSEATPSEPKQDPFPSPTHEREMEELRKRNQELEEIINEQKNSGSYKMSSSPVGMCVLINNVEFEKNRMHEEYNRRKRLNDDPNQNVKPVLPRLDLKDRIGSNIDASKLEKIFECFDFDVQRHDDLDQRGMKRVIMEAASADHSNYDCFMLIILSHGDTGCVFGVDGFPVQNADIQKPFYSDNCKTLANKPKILIFQACQGVKTMPAVAPEADVTHDGPQPEYLADHSTPSKADFLTAYSTVPGYISYRSKVEGSYFVMEIVKIFKHHFEREDLLSMMIMVNNEVGKYSHKQVPMPIPTLRKKVFFHLKEGCSLDDIDDGIEGEYHEYDDCESETLGAVGGSVFEPPTGSISTSTQESGEQEP